MWLKTKAKTTPALSVIVPLLVIVLSCQLIGALEFDKQYSKYNIRFKYPKDMYFVQESGDETLGGLVIGRLSGGAHILSVVWGVEPFDPKQLTENLGRILNLITPYVGLSGASLGSVERGKVKEHPVTYVRLTARLEAIRVDGAVGFWHCDTTIRAMSLLSLDITNGFDSFMKYLDSFDCHPQRCMVAAATLGSALAPEVQLLRTFRDRFVRSTFVGTSFMKAFDSFYYSFSPTVAAIIASDTFIAETTRVMLVPLLQVLKILTISTGTESGVVLGGLGVAALVGIVYLSLPIAVMEICLEERKNRKRAGVSRYSVT